MLTTQEIDIICLPWIIKGCCNCHYHTFDFSLFYVKLNGMLMVGK